MVHVSNIRVVPLGGLALFCQSMPRLRQPSPSSPAHRARPLRGRSRLDPDDPDATIAVRTAPIRILNSQHFVEHTHAWDQLSFAVSGSMTVSTPGASWLVPSHRAVWIPAGTLHSEQLHGDLAIRSLYVATSLARMVRSCSTLNVSPLLRELMVQACRYGALDRRVPEQRNLTAVLLDVLAAAPVKPLHLPMPLDPRALRTAERWLANPSDGTAYAAKSGMGAADAHSSAYFCAKQVSRSAHGDDACASSTVYVRSPLAKA
jgi:hypothetical protein